ncbi:MAG: DUF4350 domain-containing protein [Candidatus Accumulibacter sp.]|jgi:hypothetical protein|nr:DUF4350 domain-containing protein [Accumulibacter sp.]
MSRHAIWSMLAVAALCTLCALWFFDNFERVSVKRHEGMKVEARRNPYLAAERLFQRLGRTVTHIGSPAALDALNDGGVLILGRAGHRALGQEQARRLLQWVERGGYLIVEAEFSGEDEDFLLEPFDISPAEPSPWCGKPDVDVVLPDGTVRYRLDPADRGLAAGETTPEWHVAGPNGAAILHYVHGRGKVTVFDSLSFLGNRRLGELDHAELAWALLQHYQPDGVIHLAVRLEFPTLWQWLMESAWMALISAALLIALWLWRVIPRFGGARASPDAARRDLVQHLLAIGRSLWREGGLAYLRDVARRETGQRLALRHPALTRRPPGERHAALARMAGLDSRKIGEALADERPPSPESFTRAMQTLQHLEHEL